MIGDSAGKIQMMGGYNGCLEVSFPRCLFHLSVWLNWDCWPEHWNTASPCTLDSSHHGGWVLLESFWNRISMEQVFETTKWKLHNLFWPRLEVKRRSLSCTLLGQSSHNPVRFKGRRHRLHLSLKRRVKEFWGPILKYRNFLYKLSSL